MKAVIKRIAQMTLTETLFACLIVGVVVVFAWQFFIGRIVVIAVAGVGLVFMAGLAIWAGIMEQQARRK